jgi:hypothetical protein
MGLTGLTGGNEMIKYLEGEYTLVERPLWWQKRGLQETATGYGARLRSSKMVQFPDGKLRRVYITCYGNSGSAWINHKGEKLYLRD